MHPRFGQSCTYRDLTLEQRLWNTHDIQNVAGPLGEPDILFTSPPQVNADVLTDTPQTSAAYGDLQAFVTQPGFATPTPSISPRPVNRLSRKRRRVAINSTPADPPVSIQNIPPQTIQPVDFYTEDVLRGDATETWSSVLAEFSEAIKNVPEVILTDNSEVVTSSGVLGAPTTEGLTVPVKSSVELPSSQYHFNHELMLEITDQGALNRLLLDRTDNIQGTLQRIVQSHENERCQKQLTMRSVRDRNEHLSITEQLQEIIDQQIEVFGGDYRNFDMFLQDLDLPEAIDEPSSPNICEMLEEIIQMQNLDFERLSNILQTGDGQLEVSEEPETVKDTKYVKVRRVNIVKDVLEIFIEPEVAKKALRIEFINENAIDDDGVSRELYTAFWEDFLTQCEGEVERAPRLRPEFSDMEWKAVGRVWVKGFIDHGIITVKLFPTFILACIHNCGDEELLMSSFLKYLSTSEQSVIEKANQGNMDDNDAEELLDLFSRMGSYRLPPKENVRSAILTMAHKVLL
ncbi:hypothetical protein E1301_Tti019688 [Triplophysa tibetana]|uniref:HECT domain-containing protein n=1 Tax=Triplophysa tibetana TaxID=1572043 RepID=A0A5A9PFH7_9TELE|nr:hypothetical protein E1301_Tti019688 [Triplophysa tibetana]